jgi:hypothetical protein
MTPELRKAFAANRRPGRSPGYWRPAFQALAMARKALISMAEAEAAKAAAYGALRAAQEVDGRRYAPGMVSARDQLAKANRAWESAYDSTARAWPLKGNDSTLGAAFPIGNRGPRGPFGQWCENPPLRYVGLAHELARLDHTGWYLDPDGDGELAQGAVYQLAPLNGRARYVPAIPDPHNPGAAILTFGEVETAADSSEGAAEDARRDAARRADQLAEYYAEAEREYQTAFREGQEAREKAAEATAAAKAWAGAVRAVRKLFRARHGLGIYGLPLAEVRAEAVRAIAAARAACEELRDARDAAAKARRDRPSGLNPDRAAWFDGYAEGLS